MLLLRSPSLDATHRIAAAVAMVCRGGDTVVLAGEMGSGKTAFAQGVGRALGVDTPMTSPTYTLVHSYELGRRSPSSLHHADLYRLTRTAEVADLGLDELAEYGGLVLVEWGDIVDGAFDDHLTVALSADDGDVSTRTIEVSAVGSTWAPRWSELERTTQEFAQ
ncbi:MAG: tRNA (adenosine(37)-N6)-threonylcarbamoyltransferase complex ATPase subunit type 1 TsaE [Actinomycetota bacterium]